MTTVSCPDCGRTIRLRELETRTVARPNDFVTRYRCPFCRSDIQDVSDLL